MPDLFISVDIEGCTGVASFSQCGKADSVHFDYAFARRMLTHDVNAVIRGARAGGAERIVIKDAHGNCKNLLIDQLEEGVELISGQGGTANGMMDGIDSSFGAAMLVGYHGMGGSVRAMMDHALVGGLHRFWINGREAGEILVSAAIAGVYGVPLVLVTSDERGCQEATEALVGVQTVSTKKGLGRFMGQMSPPSVTGPALESGARQAMQSALQVEPTVLAGEVSMRAEFRTTEETDLAAITPTVRRLDGYKLEWSAPSFLEAHAVALVVFQLSIRGRASVN